MNKRKCLSRNTQRAGIILLSLIFILALSVPPITVAQAVDQSNDPVPNPAIEAFAWFDRCSLIDWPEGSVEVTIVGPDYTKVTTENVSGSRYDFYPEVDLQPGTVITATNGETTKVLEISPLSAKVVRAANGFISGVATPERTFHMKTDGDHFQNPIEQDITADSQGNWSVRIGDYLPWVWFTRGEMWEGDEDGDVTYAMWHVHQPVIEIWLPENEIRAYDWPQDTELTFIVNGTDLGTVPTQPVFWYDGTEAIFNADDLQLAAGMHVTVSGRGISKSTVVQDLKITAIDIDQDVVYGYAPAKANLELADNEDSPILRFFNNGKDPNWSVDYKVPSLNGVTVDLNPGDYLRLFMRDAEKDSTVWDTYVGELPYLRAFPDRDRVDGSNWPAGQPVNLTVNGHSFDPQTADENGYVVISLTGYDLQRGDTLTMWSGSLSPISYTARQLFVDNIDVEAQTISGRVDGQQQVHVYGSEIDEYVESSESGDWMVDLSGHDHLLAPGVCAITEAWGDPARPSSTIIEWCIPNPHLIAFPENDAVEVLEWPQGANITLTIDNAPGLSWSGTADAAMWGDPRTYVRFDFYNDYDLKLNDVMHLTDGTTTIDYSVQNLSVLDANQDNNFIAGLAGSGAQIQVWPHGHDQEATVSVMAGEDGSWRADFTDLFDLGVGTCGRSQIMDGSGNATVVDWCAPKPWFTVFPVWDIYVQAFDYPLGASVHLAIDDPATEGNPDFEADQVTQVTDWNHNGAWAVFNLPPDYDMKPGDIVTLTSAGITPRMHTVQNLTVETVNVKTNTITGTADSGATVQVWPWNMEQDYTVEATTKNGKWQVDYGALGLDLSEGMSGRSQIGVNGNYTAVDWDARQTFDIYAYNPLKGTTQRITYLANTDEYNPSWSPNGKWVAHDVVKGDGSQSIYITDVKTGMSKPLAGAENGGNDAAWSPNGKWIVFDRTWSEAPGLYLVPAIGGMSKLVRQNGASADWAPNGKRLVFMDLETGAIRTIAVDGGKGPETTVAEAGFNPAWSPDGNWIAYDLDGNIWKVRVDSLGRAFGAPVLVVDLDQGAGQPTWSPDSRTIVFHSGTDTDYDIWTIRAAGGIPTRLTGAVGYGDYDPAYARFIPIVAYARFSP